MNLKTVLTPETVNLHLKGTTKEEIIDEMLEVLIAAGKVSDKAAIRTSSISSMISSFVVPFK